jgi:hypothetical protein
MYRVAHVLVIFWGPSTKEYYKKEEVF